MNRRDFLKSSTAAAAFASLALAGISCSDSGPGPKDPPPLPDGVTKNDKTVIIDLTVFPLLKTAGNFKLFSHESLRIFVINLNGSTFKAFTSVCTHQGCDVNDFKSNEIICPCHGSKYTTSGSVIAGSPAPNPLKEYAVTKPTADSLQITLA